MIRLLALLTGLAVATMAPAQTSNTHEGSLVVELEDTAATPYAGEMIMILIRGRYPDGITLETLVRPEFEGVTWMELGTDRWDDVRIDGRRWRSFERRMALFAEDGGQITVPPFTHDLTFATRTGQRIQVSFTSEPLTIDVAEQPAGAWLPARDLRITDSWQGDPARIPVGETVTRSVTIEALGIGPEAIPPMPPMRAAGLMTFADPETRSHVLTLEGPVTTVTWSWTLRPATSAPGLLEPVSLAWFDTNTRQPREAIIAPQRIAIVGAEDLGHWEGALAVPSSMSGIWVGMAVAVGFGLLALQPGRGRGGWQGSRMARSLGRLRGNPAMRALRRAARRNDPVEFRTALRRLPATSDRVAETNDIIDRYLFAGTPGPQPDLIDLSHRLQRDLT